MTGALRTCGCPEESGQNIDKVSSSSFVSSANTSAICDSNRVGTRSYPCGDVSEVLLVWDFFSWLYHIYNLAQSEDRTVQSIGIRVIKSASPQKVFVVSVFDVSPEGRKKNITTYSSTQLCLQFVAKCMETMTHFLIPL